MQCLDNAIFNIELIGEIAWLISQAIHDTYAEEYSIIMAGVPVITFILCKIHA